MFFLHFYRFWLLLDIKKCGHSCLSMCKYVRRMSVCCICFPVADAYMSMIIRNAVFLYL